MNKRIYLILEVKKRELDSRCYFAIKSCLNGYETVMSKKNNFYQYKNYFKSGMVILKSLGKNYFNEIVEMKKVGHTISVMDEEGLMYFSSEDFIKRRIYKENLKYIDYIFAWGEDDFQILTNALPEHKDKIFKTGSSRIDILKNPIKEIYLDEALKIKKKYGNFFLFNTFFTFTNHFFGSIVKKRLEVLQSEGFSEKSLVYSNGLKMEKLQAKTLEKTIDFIDKFSKKYPEEKLIIRPHMSESHELWRRLDQKYKNIHTIYDDSNTCSWIMASNFAISSNCTTSVEAFLLKKLNYNFVPINDNDVMFNLPKITGIQVDSPDNLIKKIEEFKNKNTDAENFEKIFNKNYEKLKTNMYNLSREVCSVENMIQCFSQETNKKSLKKKDIKINYFNFIYNKAKSKIRFYIMLIKATFNQEIRGRINFAIQKFPNLTVDEVEHKISSIAKKMKIENSFEVKEIYPGSFLIKKKK